MKIAYLVSRFPIASETFVVRELDAVAEREGFEIVLMSLFEPKQPFVHPRARPWLDRLERPSALEALRGLVTWAVRRPLRMLASVAIVVWRYARRPGFLARSLATIPIAAAHASRLREEGVEHVHAHYAAYPTLAAWVCRRLTGVSYSFTAHAYDLFKDQSMLAEKLRDASFAVAISEYNRRFLRSHAAGSDTPVHVVHSGIDPGAYRFRPRQVPRSGPVRALCVAALQEKKGHSILLEAIARGGDELARVELDLAGGGELRGELERRALELGLAQRVRFHGPLAESQVRDLLDRCDVFLLPSIVASDGQMEGLPVSLIEAAACGVPVIASRLSAIPELVREGETGLMVEPADADALRDALERAIDGQVHFDLEAGRRLVESEFDIRRSADRLVSLFESAAGPSPAAP